MYIQPYSKRPTKKESEEEKHKRYQNKKNTLYKQLSNQMQLLAKESRRTLQKLMSKKESKRKLYPLKSKHSQIYFQRS